MFLLEETRRKKRKNRAHCYICTFVRFHAIEIFNNVNDFLFAYCYLLLWKHRYKVNHTSRALITLTANKRKWNIHKIDRHSYTHSHNRWLNWNYVGAERCWQFDGFDDVLYKKWMQWKWLSNNNEQLTYHKFSHQNTGPLAHSGFNWMAESYDEYGDAPTPVIEQRNQIHLILCIFCQVIASKCRTKHFRFVTSNAQISEKNPKINTISSVFVYSIYFLKIII